MKINVIHVTAVKNFRRDFGVPREVKTQEMISTQIRVCRTNFNLEVFFDTLITFFRTASVNGDTLMARRRFSYYF